MGRQVRYGVLDEDRCRQVCELLRRCAVVQPDEPRPETIRGLQQLNVIHADAPLTLADVSAIDQVRARVIREMLRFAPASAKPLVADATLFKWALPGHYKSPHVDTEGFPHRLSTATLYFNTCESGAISFGRLGDEGFHAEQRLLPRPGLLVLFDSDPDNAHAVETFASGARYNLQAWFRHEQGEDQAPPREYDWTALYVFREWERLRLRWIGRALERSTAGAELRVQGLAAGERFHLALDPARLELFERVVERGEFALRELPAHEDELEAALLLACLLAQAGALVECTEEQGCA